MGIAKEADILCTARRALRFAHKMMARSNVKGRDEVRTCAGGFPEFSGRKKSMPSKKLKLFIVFL